MVGGDSVGGCGDRSIVGVKMGVGGVSSGVVRPILVIKCVPNQACYLLCIEHGFPDTVGRRGDRLNVRVEWSALGLEAHRASFDPR